MVYKMMAVLTCGANTRVKASRTKGVEDNRNEYTQDKT